MIPEDYLEKLNELTPAQLGALRLLCEGALSNEAIAEQLIISVDAVKKRLSGVYVTLGLDGLEARERYRLLFQEYCPELQRREDIPISNIEDEPEDSEEEGPQEIIEIIEEDIEAIGTALIIRPPGTALAPVPPPIIDIPTEEPTRRPRGLVLIVMGIVVGILLVWVIQSLWNQVAGNEPETPMTVSPTTSVVQVVETVLITVTSPPIEPTSPPPSQIEPTHTSTPTPSAIPEIGTAEASTTTLTLTIIPTPTSTETSVIEPTMTQSSALLFDDFEDGNDNLWSAAGSNNWVVEPTDDGQYEYMCLRPSITIYANDDWVDYTVSVDVRPTTENFAVGIVARYQNSNTFYLAELTGNQARILRRRFVVAGTGWSTLQSVGFTAVPGTTYNIAFEVRGIQLTMYIDGQEVISLVNNGSERGTVGLRCGENTLATFDNVSVESR